MGDIVVSIPAQAGLIHIVRSVVGAAAAAADLPYDEIDDLRLAVDEACAQLLSLNQSASKLTLRISLTSAGVEVVASSDGAQQEWPLPGAQQSLAWQVLSGLTDEVGFERSDGGPAIRFSKKVTV